MRLQRRRSRPPIEVGPGERVLAWAEAAEGVVAGTRDALYLRVSSVEARIAWELVEAADWDRETSVLRVSEVGTWGARRPEHLLTIEEPGRLLELVRERVTASVVLQRHVPLRGRRGLRVIARRAAAGRPAAHAGCSSTTPASTRPTPTCSGRPGRPLAAAQEEVGPGLTHRAGVPDFLLGGGPC